MVAEHCRLTSIWNRESQKNSRINGNRNCRQWRKAGSQGIRKSRNSTCRFQKLKEYWHSRIAGMSAITPDTDFNSMFNTWNPYNNLMTFAWSRAASLVYSGERDGLGYRDTVQDMLGILHSIPDDVRDRLELMLTGQVSTGGAMPVWNRLPIIRDMNKLQMKRNIVPMTACGCLILFRVRERDRRYFLL